MKHALLVSLACAAAPAAAQSGLSGSESYTMAVRATAVAAGAASSESYDGLLGAGLAPASDPIASESFELVAGVMAFDGDLGPGPPVVLAVDPPLGDEAGGEPASVVGARLVDGIGPSTVTFAGSPVLPLAATGTELQVQTPAGLNPFGNPLGAVDVGVTNLEGTGTAAGAFVYTPALVEDAAAHVGGALQISWHGPPGAYLLVQLGTSAGVGIPLPPLEGSLELVFGLVPLVPLTLSPTGQASFAFPLSSDPGLAGAVVELQSVALTSLSPLAGSFTNKLDVTIQP